MPSYIRKFSGKGYRLDSGSASKRVVEAKKKKYKEKGDSARIVYSKKEKEYLLYVRD